MSDRSRYVRLPSPRAHQGARVIVMSSPFGGRLRITTRGIQIALGVIWLLDGLFQFKSFMYTHGIITEVFGPAAEKQWSIVGGPMKTFENFYGHDLTLWNTLSGEIQVAIGLGLILSRKTVKPALLVSFAWSLVVWWFGQGFGGLTSTTLPSPLMGAPGAVILYAIVGLLVYPTRKQDGRPPGGYRAARRPGRPRRLVGAVGTVGGPVARERQPGEGCHTRNDQGDGRSVAALAGEFQTSVGNPTRATGPRSPAARS